MKDKTIIKVSVKVSVRSSLRLEISVHYYIPATVHDDAIWREFELS